MTVGGLGTLEFLFFFSTLHTLFLFFIDGLCFCSKSTISLPWDYSKDESTFTGCSLVPGEVFSFKSFLVCDGITGCGAVKKTKGS